MSYTRQEMDLAEVREMCAKVDARIGDGTMGWVTVTGTELALLDLRNLLFDLAQRAVVHDYQLFDDLRKIARDLGHP